MLSRGEGLNRKETERLILGQLLRVPEAIYEVATMLSDKMFLAKEHQILYAEIAKLHSAGKPVRRLTVANAVGEEIAGQPTAALLSALEYAAEKEDSLPLAEYAEFVALDWKRKQANSLLLKAATDALNPMKRIDDVADATTRGIEAIVGDSAEIPVISLYDAALEQLDKTAEAYQHGQRAGFDTGLSFITDLTGAWARGQFIIIGAPTKVGKTALAIQCAAGISQYDPVLFFSYEMNAKLLASREIAKRTRIGTIRQRTGAVSGQEYAKMVEAAEQMRTMRNLNVVSQKMSATQIFEFCRRWKKRKRLAAVFVDHLGIVKPEKGARGTQDWELAANAAPILKEAAEELGCVFVGVSQVLKESPPAMLKMKDKISSCLRRPGYQDLKGAIANDADHVLIPYRPAAMLAKIEPSEMSSDRAEWEAAMEKVKDKAGITLALSRESQWPRTVDVIWDGQTTQFKEIVVDQPSFGDFV